MFQKIKDLSKNSVITDIKGKKTTKTTQTYFENLMNVKDKSCSTLWMDNGKIKIINQTKLPLNLRLKN